MIQFWDFAPHNFGSCKAQQFKLFSFQRAYVVCKLNSDLCSHIFRLLWVMNINHHGALIHASWMRTVNLWKYFIDVLKFYGFMVRTSQVTNWASQSSRGMKLAGIEANMRVLSLGKLWIISKLSLLMWFNFLEMIRSFASPMSSYVMESEIVRLVAECSTTKMKNCAKSIGFTIRI